MNTRLIQSVLRHAAAAANGSSAAGDAALLRSFAASRDPAAFAELVRRYGRLVWAVCRQLRPTDADAEDAFQATFLVLLRSAGSVRTAALGPWLHTVAHRVACKAGRADGRRRKRETGAAAPDRDAAVPPSAWDALAAALHEEVAKLPDHLRVPFVLCCLEGRGTTDAAKQLGWKLGTLSGRLTRAKQALLDRLAKRGLPAAAVAVGVTATAVPATVAAKALDLIHLGDAIPSTILELAKGATTMTKTKLLAAGLLIAAGLMTGVGGWLATADGQTPYRVEAGNGLRINVPPLGENKPGAKWEYHYQSMLFDKNGKPTGMKAADFEKLLETMEAEGWSYLGQADIASTGPVLPSHAFRRPKNDAAKAQMQRLYEMQLIRAREQLGDPAQNAAVVEARDVILQRMRKDPTETFDAALATKLKASPQLAAAVEAYGRTVLHVDVLAALLAEARQGTAGKAGRPDPTAPQAVDAARRVRQAEEELKTVELLVKKKQAEAELNEAEEALKKAPAADQKTLAELLLKRQKAQLAVTDAEAAATARTDPDAAAVRKRIAELRANKTSPVRFDPADYGLTGAELQMVLQEAIQRKFNTTLDNNPIKLTRSTAAGANYVEATGQAAHLLWLKGVMDGVAAKPAAR